MTRIKRVGKELLPRKNRKKLQRKVEKNKFNKSNSLLLKKSK
jgi:hypothetical protein